MLTKRILKITRVLLVLSGLFVFSCKDTKKQKPIPDNNPTKVELKGSFCFKNETSSDLKIEGQKLIDVEELIIDINDGIVTGTYNYLPAEKDQRIGTFTGIVTNKTIFAKYIYTQEGEETTAYIKITINESDAVLEPDDSTYDMTSKITKINCDNVNKPK